MQRCPPASRRALRARRAITTLTLLTACSGGSVPFVEVGADELAAAQTAQLVRAEHARNEFATTLLGELTKALADSGPVGAITICQTRAPAIAAGVGHEHGVRIGRTAARLRNPHNAPPPWAEAALAAATDADVTARHFVGDDGTFATLHPIRLMPLCVRCHGPEAELAAGVREALQQRYPDDRAIGFAPGALRGWFWVEVPPR